MSGYSVAGCHQFISSSTHNHKIRLQLSVTNINIISGGEYVTMLMMGRHRVECGSQSMQTMMLIVLRFVFIEYG